MGRAPITLAVQSTLASDCGRGYPTLSGIGSAQLLPECTAACNKPSIGLEKQKGKESTVTVDSRCSQKKKKNHMASLIEEQRYAAK
jgi:hypothetical protein